ncbi:MAG: hypothetical protein KME10_11795 [Plectolyngbya sp. WJT66-NPBG17]|jgi:hypothetical protein|nr:hypothetical protein [Plectolyngbya sp. WJT66-NPBG17]
MSAPSKSELKEIVREILIELLGGVQASELDQWLDLREAWGRLGYPSYTACYKAVQAGLFREGKEIRDRRKPGAKIAKWQINIALANKRLLQSGEKRSNR